MYTEEQGDMYKSNFPFHLSFSQTRQLVVFASFTQNFAKASRPQTSQL